MRRDIAPSMQSIGYWSWGADPTLLVDPAWALGEREALADYLRSGRPYRAYLGHSFCRFQCGIPNEQMGSQDLTDGVWVWPEGLAHYVIAHDIALPDDFLAHARSNRFVVPESIVASGKVVDHLWDQWTRDRRASPLDRKPPNEPL